MSDLKHREEPAVPIRAHGGHGRTRKTTTPPRRDIQGLRAVAVLAVILNHLFNWPHGAFVGVDVFFVISGFLITGILVRQYEKDGTISAVGFYRRRVKRIIPAAVLVLFVTVAASIALLPWSRAWAIIGDAVAALFFVSNWRFAAQGTDYFQRGSLPSPIQHYWSLSVEEQFYFVWPWLMLLVLVVGTRVFAWERRHGRLVAGVLMGAIIAASLGWAILQTDNNAEYAYFSTLTRVWELGAGALLAIAEPKLRISKASVRTSLAWLGMVTIVASLFMVSAGSGFPAPWAAMPVLGTVIVIASGCGGDQPYLGPLTSSGAQYVGNISYSLYLWHFPVIVLLASLMQTETPAYYGTAIALIAGLSTASFHLVEDPARNADWIDPGHGWGRFAEGWKYVGLVAVAVPALALVAYTAMPGRLVSPQSTLPDSVLRDHKIADQNAETLRCVGAAAMVKSHNCPLNDGPGLTPPVDNLTLSEGAFDCWFTMKDPLKLCHFGSNDPAATKLAIVGDSHSALLIPAIREWLGDRNWSVDTFAGENCQLEAGVPGQQLCKALPAIRQRLETGKYDAVITTTGRDRYSAGMDVEPVVNSYEQAWEPIRKAGTKIIVVADDPLPSKESMLCVQRAGFSPARQSCGTKEKDAYAKPDLPVITAPHVPGTAVIDMRDYFCRDGFCPSVIGNVIVYRDLVGHMTEPYAVTLGQFLVPEIEKALTGRAS